MKVFISWSGETSHQVAIALERFLKRVIQTSEPFVSSSGIDKGARWFDDISGQLDACQFGIICLTKENLDANWIHFEAGALAKNVSKSKVAPLLIDLAPADVAPPLSQFQLTRLVKADLFRLIGQINRESAMLEAEDLEETFNVWWPRLEEAAASAQLAEAPDVDKKPDRSDRELLEELLQLVRAYQQGGASRNDVTAESAILDYLFGGDFIYGGKGADELKLLKRFVFPGSFVADTLSRLMSRGYIARDERGLIRMTPNGTALYASRSRQALREAEAALDEKDSE